VRAYDFTGFLFGHTDTGGIDQYRMRRRVSRGSEGYRKK
jgi:hypothetical protein